ncbi:MAG: ribose-phosphate diphosphokinase [bacterium]|jgi:ribose-phosphate pyrophosphokinase
MSAYGEKDLKIFSGNANPNLAREIARHLGTKLGDVAVSRFSNGETRVNVNESVRGADVFVVQPTSTPVNDNLMELLVLIDALRRASADRITAVIPCYGYARQDRKTKPREPITAKLVANLLTSAGAGRILTVDLHAGQIQGFFDIPVDHLSGIPILAEYFARKDVPELVVVSPDLGGVTRARDFAERLQVPIAIVDKRRPEPGVAEIMSIVGKVAGKNIIIVDDIIDTAGTLTLGAQALKERGAQQIFACCTHPVLSGPAMERLAMSCIDEVVVANTIPVSNTAKSDKIIVLSIAPLLADAIKRIHADQSVSELFN